MLTVGAPAVVSIAVTPNPATASVGSHVSFTATATYTNQTVANISNLVTWTSSNNTVSTVDATGLAYGASPGTVTVTAALGAIQGTAMLTVVGYPALALGAHARTDNSTTSSAAVVVSLGTPKAGSTIVCGFAFSNSAAFVSLVDNVNSGNYQPAASMMREAGHNYIQGIYYRENVAASATTVTLTYSPAETHGRMECAEIQNTPTSYAFDSNVVAGQAISGANPITGGSVVPTIAGEFIYAGLSESGGTVSAGTNFTLLDAMTGTSSAQWVPEYWIQTSAASTNGPYSDSTSASYGDQIVAFAPQQGGTCGVSAVMDWTGGTNGSAITAAALQSSTKGGAAQPNSDRAYDGGNSDRHAPGWVYTGSAIKFSSSAYAPLQTTRTCPFYTGSGSGTLGLDLPTSDTSGTGPSYYFDAISNTVTAWACISTTAAASGAIQRTLWSSE